MSARLPCPQCGEPRMGSLCICDISREGWTTHAACYDAQRWTQVMAATGREGWIAAENGRAVNELVVAQGKKIQAMEALWADLLLLVPDLQATTGIIPYIELEAKHAAAVRGLKERLQHTVIALRDASERGGDSHA